MMDRIFLSPQQLEELHGLYDRTLYLQAWRRAGEIGPVEQWGGVEAMVLAGRILQNTFAPRTARRLIVRAWREHRGSAMAATYYAATAAGRLGPLAGLKLLRKLPSDGTLPPDEEVHRLTLEASLLAHMRDFRRAFERLQEAEKIDASQAWRLVTTADCCKLQDRYEEALDHARRALEIRPGYRPAVIVAAEVLSLSSREEEAIHLLEEALQTAESPHIAWRLATTQQELGQHREAQAALRRARELAFAIEPEAEAEWEGRLGDVCYALGEIDEALGAYDRSKSPFYTKAAESIRAHPEGRRVVWPVPFVRQHHVTCAPATISALSRFFAHDIDHLELARVICYDGTPDHVGRHWLQENGWLVREFRVTWETARALLDRGVPFAITTVETQSAHLQAIVGYDERKGILVIRDPFFRAQPEAAAVEWLARYESTGPQGMVLLPQGRAALLEGIELPEVALYDRRHRLQRALHRHDRSAAAEELAALETAAPGGRLALEAAAFVASYDGSTTRQLEAVESLLALYPKDANLALRKLALLRYQGRRTEVEDLLRERSAGDEPAFWLEWGRDLAIDARQHPQARRLFARTLHHRPAHADALSSAGHLLWSGQQFAEGLEHFRLAAMLADKSIDFARTFFQGARHLRQTEAALEILRERADLHREKSSEPVRLLFWALTALDRTGEAFAHLAAALEKRPEDGELLLFAADAYARYAEPERGQHLLQAAETRSARPSWLRAAASVAEYTCDLPRALGYWREAHALEPLAMDAAESTLRLLEQVEGPAAALAFAEATSAAFPHHLPLRVLAIRQVRGMGKPGAEEMLRDLLRLEPSHAWACRELALVLSAERRFAEAEAEIARSREIEPHEPATYGVGAQVLQSAGRLAEAREMYRSALRLSIDLTYGMHGLLACAETYEQRREAVAFLLSELEKQTVYGDGLLGFRHAAFSILEPADLLRNLQEANAARPDLWHSWVALIQQHCDMGGKEEALKLAREAISRFPLEPRAWQALASAHEVAGQLDAELEAARKAFSLAPSEGFYARALADAQMRANRFEDAGDTMQKAIAAAPLDAVNVAVLAELLWRMNRRKEAMAKIEHALELSPGYSWAWDKHDAWSQEAGEPYRTLRLAERLKETRPGEARSWLILAKSVPEGETPRALEALDRAQELNPRLEEAQDLRVWLLTREQRFEEALAACDWPSAEEPLYTLQGRKAWVEDVRGRTRRAIELMNAVVTSNPDYYWGWSQLAEWHEKLEETEQAIAAARQMVRLSPGNAIPLGYLASITRKIDVKKADEYLEEALRVNPQYEYASSQLFYGHLRAERYQEAERMLERWVLHNPGAQTTAARVALLCAQRKHKQALPLLRELCFAPDVFTSAFITGANAFIGSPAARQAEKIYAECKDDPKANAEVAAYWARSAAQRKAWGKLRELRRMNPHLRSGIRARVIFLEATAETNQRRLFQRLVARERELLHGYDELWGTVGYGYATLNMDKECAAWLHDWRVRRGVKPWMLHNYAWSNFVRGQRAEARAALDAGLQMTPDNTRPLMTSLAALEAALALDAERTRTLLADCGAPPNTFCDLATSVARAILAVHNAPAAERRTTYRGKLKELRERDELHLGQWKRIFHEAIQRMAQLAGSAFGQRCPAVLAWKFTPGRIFIISVLVFAIIRLATALIGVGN